MVRSWQALHEHKDMITTLDYSWYGKVMQSDFQLESSNMIVVMVTKAWYRYMCLLVSVCQATLVIPCVLVLSFYVRGRTLRISLPLCLEEPPKQAQDQRARSEGQLGERCWLVKHFCALYCILYSFFIFPFIYTSHYIGFV